jgi:hypothetical protein
MTRNSAQVRVMARSRFEPPTLAELTLYALLVMTVISIIKMF